MTASAQSLNRQLLKALKNIPKSHDAVKSAMEALLGMLNNIPALVKEEIVPLAATAALSLTQAQLEHQILGIVVSRTQARDARIEAEQLQMHESTRAAIEKAVGARFDGWWILNRDMVLETKDYVDRQLALQQNVVDHMLKSSMRLQSSIDNIEEKFRTVQTWLLQHAQTRSGVSSPGVSIHSVHPSDVDEEPEVEARRLSPDPLGHQHPPSVAGLVGTQLISDNLESTDFDRSASVSNPGTPESWPETERTDTASATAGRLHVALSRVQRSLRAQATTTVSLPCRIKRAQLAAWARNITLPAVSFQQMPR
jgi:hypothetical protein